MLKVVNGQKAQLGEFPYAAHVFLRGRTVCGGTLISDRHILTAAHCVLRIPPSTSKRPPTVQPANRFTVTLGRLANDTTGQIGVSRIKVDTFNTLTSENDLAVLELVRPVRFTASVRPARIAPSLIDPSGGSPFSNAMRQGALPPSSPLPPSSHQLLAYGWGRNASFVPTTELRWVSMVFGDEKMCQATSPEYVSPRSGPFICVAGARRNTGVCAGDSGGPLMWRPITAGVDANDAQGTPIVAASDDEPRVLGVLSFGGSTVPLPPSACASSGLMQFFIRVANRMDFLTSATGMSADALVYGGNAIRLDEDLNEAPQTIAAASSSAVDRMVGMWMSAIAAAVAAAAASSLLSQ
ncbi:trypsin-like cysteine/serine peptidase domain-containing protein [Thamnocephalis sphaerospora]|uniref:Trypsin-like cysteine/serine peptidase domain-containing protein n=1 Tax=Thamnocephalis sphaerospora TaxID=78915 RepID=A0A4P9XGR2_9FUNG|nr:trypsin-like cysteine/serine peptidase domain-containing protein [Thamnocephalis sphaerospora]|eukprot:RKP04833.1 trypsin-like cysteine/serine peptidase domain-containing protein [Thamnocephalis sphaerospora]